MQPMLSCRFISKILGYKPLCTVRCSKAKLTGWLYKIDTVRPTHKHAVSGGELWGPLKNTNNIIEDDKPIAML